jgi:hypothetical protein
MIVAGQLVGTFGNYATVVDIAPDGGIYEGGGQDNVLRRWTWNGSAWTHTASISKYVTDLDAAPDGSVYTIATQDASLRHFIYNGTATLVTDASVSLNAKVIAVDAAGLIYTAGDGVNGDTMLRVWRCANGMFTALAAADLGAAANAIAVVLKPLPPANILGDINRDDSVGMKDLAVLAQWWLANSCTAPRWCEGSDIDESGAVDFVDFAYVAGKWLYTVLHNLGYTVLSPGGPSDGGDFGPNTQGTQTAGFQEAINFAANNHKDLFVGRRMEYDAQSPIAFPPLENFLLKSGNYLLRIFVTTGSCMSFDSLENSEFQLGMMGSNYQTPLTASILKVKPQSPTPSGLVGVVNNTIFLSCLGGGGWGWGGYPSYGIGLHLDGSQGPINCNRMVVMEPIACATGILLDQGEICGNLIDSRFNHINNNELVVNTGSFNRINMLFSGGGNIGTTVAADFEGGNENLCRFNFDNTFTKYLVFGPNTRDNLVYVKDLPVGGITNNATSASSRVIPLKPVGFGVTTPSFPNSGADLENRSSYLVVATITSAGAVSSWTQTDTSGLSQVINAGLYIGQLIYLEPGEKVRFTYSGMPTWRWKALR